jgi:hypothetical protein
MSIWRTVLSLGLFINLISAAYGDIAPIRNPLPKPPMVAPVKIVDGKIADMDPNVVAKIIIPKSLLPDLQGSSSMTRDANHTSHAGTVIAGLALAAAAISLMFANKKSPHWKKGAIGIICCVVLAGTVLLADFFFPPKDVALATEQSIPQQLILFELQDHGHEVTLLLPSRK